MKINTFDAKLCTTQRNFSHLKQCDAGAADKLIFARLSSDDNTEVSEVTIVVSNQSGER